MAIENFISQLRSAPHSIAFSDCLFVIDKHYVFSPTEFKNGDVVNHAGQNNASCKIFAFAQEQNLSKEETLACFGTYYSKEVLGNPEGDDHQNIRNFMKTSWEGISFSEPALIKKY